MAPLIGRRIFFALICLPLCLTGWSQNLIPNPSFEVYTTCPISFGTGGPLPCTPWTCATAGSCDYFNACATPGSPADVPDNFAGSQDAHTGQAYAGGYAKYLFPYREYLLAPLITPLVAGEFYYFSMYVSLADNDFCGIDHLGAYFSVNPPPPGGVTWLNVTPQVESQIGFISDENGWTYIDGCFYATGGEAYITIGNFHDDVSSPTDPLCTDNPSKSYYYVDDVSLTVTVPPAPIVFDLGDPVQACSEYVIDPQIPNVFYTWEDGSHGSTLTVTTSGTYSLTVNEGCSFGIDSLEVEIIGNDPPVEIGADSVVICQGDVYTITLDPGAGSYEWSNGTFGSQINISTSGTYSVTMDDDGCDLTTDQVEIIVVDPPAPFTLGDDTYICPGLDISYSFDPALGDFLWNDGSTSPDYTIDMGGNYSLTISNMCGEYADDITIEMIQPPMVDFGPDDYMICEGDVLEFELDPDMGDYLWQDGNTNNFYAVTEPGHYQVTVTNECGTDDADLYVVAIPDPVIDLGPDQVICSGQLPLLLDVSNSGGDNYLWQDGSADSEFSVTQSGTYSVTVSNDCVSVSDEVVITVQESLIDVALPEDQLLCPGETFLITNAGDTGEYLWQDGSTSATYLASAPGTYYLTVTTPCGSNRDSITIQYMNPVATPDLGPDVSLCPGEQLVLTPNLTGVTYLWQDGSTADSFLVTGGGTYYVKVADLCTSATDTMVVTVNNNPPQLSLPDQLNLCQGQTLSLDAGVGGVSYLWSDNSQTSSITVSSPGTFSLTVSNACGADADTVVVLDGGPAPFISLGGDVALCAGDMVTLNPVSADVTSWLWNDGSTAPTYTITNAGMITVAVSNSCGTAYDSLNATILPATPLLDLGTDTAICPGSSWLLSITTPGVSITWSDNSVGNNLVVNNPGTYYATISNACGSNSDTIAVGLLPPAPVLNLGQDQSLCPGETITLNPGLQNVSYLWQDGSTSTSFNATQAGQIILTVSNSCGSATDSLNITISNNGPMVDLGPDILACEGDVVTLMANVSGVNYLWQDGSTSSSISTSSSGLYYLQVSNNCGVDIDSVNVVIDGTPPDTELGPDTTLCKGNNLLLSSTADPGTNIQWQDGSSLPSYLVTTAGLYSITESNHCGVHSDSIRVDFLDPPPSFDLGPDTILCPGESILLTSPITGYIFTWQDGSTGNSIVADKAQTYSLILSNRCGMASDALTVSYDNHVPVLALGSTQVLCPGEAIVLNATQSFPANYLWTTGSTLPVIDIVTPGTYGVTVFALCVDAQDEIAVIQADDCYPTALYLPNVFSPNDDNVNDVFSLSTNPEIQITNSQGAIFDRWGNLIYQSTEIPFTWNGHARNGQSFQPGVYVYSLILDYSVNGLQQHTVLKGDVTLIR
jgi:gliding motility-associated-like protein